MVETDSPTQEKPAKTKQEVVLYHTVHREFEWDNIYAMGGARPNAKHIAGQYGVELEFRLSRYRPPVNTMVFPNYLERWGIFNGNCLTAVLVGEDREQLLKAKRDIHQTFGVSSLKLGSIDVGTEKPLF